MSLEANTHGLIICDSGLIKLVCFSLRLLSTLSRKSPQN